MPEYWFYHLDASPVETVLPDLLDKVAARGWRAYVHGRDDTGIQALDRHLWTYDAASFLAHGREGEGNETLQPVLLGASGGMANRPDVYVSVAPQDLPDVDGLQRCLMVFDGADEAHLGWARMQWKALKTKGAALAYWQQDERGRWERKS